MNASQLCEHHPSICLTTPLRLQDSTWLDPTLEAVKAVLVSADDAASLGGSGKGISIDDVIMWNVQRTAGVHPVAQSPVFPSTCTP